MICGWVCHHRARASGKLSDDSSSAALKRLLYLTSRGEGKAFGQAASGALLFGVRHASDTQASQVRPQHARNISYTAGSDPLLHHILVMCHACGHAPCLGRAFEPNVLPKVPYTAASATHSHAILVMCHAGWRTRPYKREQSVRVLSILVRC